MRHGKKFNHLGRQKALLKNLSIALITHKRINTTLAKAKALRVHLEPLVTKSKNNTTHSRRVVFSYLQNKFAVQELFDGIAAKVAARPGGYLRIIKTGFRKGDGAEMAMIEFVDYNDVFTNAKDSDAGSSKKSRRSRRGKKAAGAAAAATQVVEEVVVEKEVENVGDDDPELQALNEQADDAE